MKDTFPTGKQKNKKIIRNVLAIQLKIISQKKKITKIAGWEIYKQKVFTNLLVVQSCITIY